MIFKIIFLMNMKISVFVAGDSSFSSALSDGKSLKALNQDSVLHPGKANFDWQQTGQINHLLQVQIGKIYQRYRSDLDLGVFSRNKNRADYRKELKNIFESVKKHTKARLQHEHEAGSRKRRMRHKFYQRYLQN